VTAVRTTKSLRCCIVRNDGEWMLGVSVQQSVLWDDSKGLHLRIGLVTRSLLLYTVSLRKPTLSTALLRLSERVARRALAELWDMQERGTDIYDQSEPYRRDVLFEDDRADLFAPAKAEGYWEPFKLWKPRHIRALLKSRRLLTINMGEFE
jgi:hypothetical protein